MSSFQTVGRIKCIRSYADAKARYENTKPIRGSDNLRPIGERRDAARYYIKEIRDEKLFGAHPIYHAMLYNTPVVAYLETGEIYICTYGHDTALTMDFIGQVLGIGAGRTRGQCVFTIAGLKYVTSGDKGGLVLRTNAEQYDGYEVISKQEHKQYVVSRTGANNVRRRYSEFRGYLKGFISLRAETVTFTGYRPDQTRNLLRVPTEELVEVLGLTSHQEPHRPPSKYVNVYGVINLWSVRASNYEEINAAFDKLIANGQPEETRSANFYKACLMIATAAACRRDGSMAINTIRLAILADPKFMVETLDEVQFKYFDQEVFVLADVPEGKVPNHKYNSWIRHPIQRGHD